MNEQWNEIYVEDFVCTDRMEVPGGWIYRAVVYRINNDDIIAVSMVFVPEPEPR